MMLQRQSTEAIASTCGILNPKLDQTPGTQAKFTLDSNREQPVIDGETREVRQP
jgi:hypothetical protein